VILEEEEEPPESPQKQSLRSPKKQMTSPKKLPVSPKKQEVRTPGKIKIKSKMKNRSVLRPPLLYQDNGSSLVYEDAVSTNKFFKGSKAAWKWRRAFQCNKSLLHMDLSFN